MISFEVFREKQRLFVNFLELCVGGVEAVMTVEAVVVD